MKQGRTKQMTCFGQNVNAFELGCAYKITHISAVPYPELLNLVPNKV